MTEVSLTRSETLDEVLKVVDVKITVFRDETTLSGNTLPVFLRNLLPSFFRVRDYGTDIGTGRKAPRPSSVSGLHYFTPGFL